MTRTQELYQQALRQLAPEERQELAHMLYASLPEESGESEEDLDDLWAEELQRRIDQVDSGAVALMPFDEAFRQITTPPDQRKA